MASSRRRFRIRISGPIIIFVIMVAVFAIASRRFFTLSNAANIIRQGSVLALAAFGQTFVILLGGIDLSIGAVMGLTSCAAAISMVNLGFSPLLAVLVALLVSLLCGTINGVVANYIGLNPFVATFGMWGMALGVALIITEERVIYGFPETLRVLHDGELLRIPVPLFIVLAVWAVLHIFLRRTPKGTATYAIGGNEEAARLSGISVRLHKTLIYSFSGLMAGMAGILFLARTNAAQAIDTIGFEFDSICAVVLGGTVLAGGRGGAKETLIGVFLFATLRNGLNMMGVNLYLQLVFVGVILILAYVAESQRQRQRPLFGFLQALGSRAKSGDEPGEG
jgi:ribose transport system permease protein